MKSFKLAALSIVAVTMTACLTAPADPPATRPASQSAQPVAPSPRVRAQQLRQLLRALTGNTNNIRPFTPQEWDDMMAFLEENSHARWYVLSNLHLPENSPIRLGAIREWRNYNFTKEHFPAVADEMLKRYKLEDELFGLTIKAVSSDQSDEEIRDLIKNKISEMVQLDLSERQLRIDKLQKLLDAEKQNLQRDQAMEEQVIAQRTSGMMARLERLRAATQPSATTQPSGAGPAPDGAVTTDTPAGDNDSGAAAPDPIVNTSNSTDQTGGK
jgi:TolA-binding protein